VIRTREEQIGRGPSSCVDCDRLPNVCYEPSARDAMMLNFRTVMVSDANAARSDAEHNAALATFYAIFGDVMDTSHIVERLEVGSATPIAAE
jgi:isochorismate hydrolase